MTALVSEEEDVVGIYAEYLDRMMSPDHLVAERKAQLHRISSIRNRDVLVIAADLSFADERIAIGSSDVLPIQDQLSNLGGQSLDLILETPGGSGEVAEDIVRMIRNRYPDVAIIIPGTAKSAGTIVAMSGNEILMEPNGSSLGPIDAQLKWQGKVFSAEALLQGVEKIKAETEKVGTLNKAYIPILQQISPGELEHAYNALGFAKLLVKDWLARYKFGTWLTHSSTGQPVTEQEKVERAQEIADQLCDHGRWKTHGRSIKIADLEAMRLQVTDYSTIPDLHDAIQRYYVLLQMWFEQTNTFKVFETPNSQIYKVSAQQPQTPAAPQAVDSGVIDLECHKCKVKSQVFAPFKAGMPIPAGTVIFPSDSKFKCPSCGTVHDLKQIRQNLEQQAGKKLAV